LNNKKNDLFRSSRSVFGKHSSGLKNFHEKLHFRIKYYLQNENSKIHFIEQNIRLTDPSNVLKRGYSISKINGKVVKNAKALKKGDIMETFFYKDKVVSEIIDKKENE
jgi:exodeoxyribonuclease VII large subunit